MEPMALGSPMSSPVQSSLSLSGTPSNTAYLPSFLLGDNNTSTKIASPQENPRHLSFTSPMPTTPILGSSYGTPDYRSNRQKAVFGNTTASTPQMSSKNHTGGPPTRSLFDALEVGQAPPGYTSFVEQNVTSATSQSRLMSNTIGSPVIFPDVPMNLNLNTSESQGLLQWVTVFGFLPTDVNAVLSHISSRVRIVDKHLGPQPQSNWIHLKCASEQEAQRALTCNGSIVSGSIMIGVIPCTDEGVVMSTDKENRAKLNGSIRSLSSIVKTSQSPNVNGRWRKLRSLATDYNQHLSPQAAQSSENVPQKSISLVSRAMDYVFGW